MNWANNCTMGFELNMHFHNTLSIRQTNWILFIHFLQTTIEHCVNWVNYHHSVALNAWLSQYHVTCIGMFTSCWRFIISSKPCSSVSDGYSLQSRAPFVVSYILGYTVMDVCCTKIIECIHNMYVSVATIDTEYIILVLGH